MLEQQYTRGAIMGASMEASLNRGMIGEQQIKKAQPPVHDQIEQLEKAVHYLRESVSILEQRLSYVTCPMPEQDTKGSHPIPGGSALTAVIARMNVLVLDTAHKVRSINDSLEI